MLDLTGHMISWGGLFAHGDGPLPRPSGYEPVLSRRRFARSTCTWTVNNIPRLTKTLHQSYNDGMVNPEVVCHPSMDKTTVIKTTPREDRLISRQARQRPFSTAGALRGNLAFGGHISTRTVIRRLHHQGMRARRPIK
jgi:hypothetical protein